MVFKDYVEMLSKELGVEIETTGDACAFSLGSGDGEKVEILMQGIEDKGTLLTCADLGDPPPEGRERLFQTLLEANDLYGDTAGAMLSLNPRTGRVRLQRYDDMDVLSQLGPARALTVFADTAAAWKKLIADFRDAPSKESDDMSKPFDAMRV